MNKTRIIIALISVAALVFSLTSPAIASNVVYDDSVFKINLDNDGDLFENFKGCMPGDVLTQKIDVKNDAKNKVTIDVYLRSSGATEESKALLSQMNLSVCQIGKSVLYDGPADKATGMDDWVFLGTVYSGGDIELELELEIPITVDDRFQNAIGKVIWEFKTEEHAIDTGIRECPVCGDEMDNVTVVDPVTGEEYVIHVCDHCGYETEMRCPICGERMHEVVIRGEDGHYYIYYVCLHDESHHTDPYSPQTGESMDTVIWISIAAISLLGGLLCVFAYKRRKEQEN